MKKRKIPDFIFNDLVPRGFPPFFAVVCVVLIYLLSRCRFWSLFMPCFASFCSIFSLVVSFSRFFCRVLRRFVLSSLVVGFTRFFCRVLRRFILSSLSLWVLVVLLVVMCSFVFSFQLLLTGCGSQETDDPS